MGLPEQVMDISPSNIGLTTGTPRQWPPRAVALELGVTETTIPQTSMVSAGQSARAERAIAPDSRRDPRR